MIVKITRFLADLESVLFVVRVPLLDKLLLHGQILVRLTQVLGFLVLSERFIRYESGLHLFEHIVFGAVLGGFLLESFR